MAYRLHLANTTKQHRIFTYRLKKREGQTQEPNSAAWPIKPGGQICIADNFNKAEIDYIIEQNGKYGLKHSSELSRNRDFVGILYDTEKPIPLDSMLAVFETNDAKVEGEAQTRRELTAAAISDNIAQDLSDRTGRDKDRLRPARVEVEQVEETSGKPHVASGVEVLGNPETTRSRRARA